MKLSVIIPVYNAADTIEDSIVSVDASVGMVTDSYEIICIDDGSTDSSLAVMQRMASCNPHIRIVSRRNAGAGAARNCGLDNALGEFIAFNDADDKWSRDHAKALFEAFDRNPECDCITSVYGRDRIHTGLLRRTDTKNLYQITLRDELFKNYFAQQTAMFRRSVIDAGIRFDTKVKGSEEVLFFMHIAKRFNTALLNRRMTCSIKKKRRYGEGGLSGNLWDMERGELYAINKAYVELGQPFVICLLAYVFSLIKYLRRVLVVAIRR